MRRIWRAACLLTRPHERDIVYEVRAMGYGSWVMDCIYVCVYIYICATMKPEQKKDRG